MVVDRLGKMCKKRLIAILRGVYLVVYLIHSYTRPGVLLKSRRGKTFKMTKPLAEGELLFIQNSSIHGP